MTHARKLMLAVPWLVVATLASSHRAVAGPWYNLGWKVLRADAIVEVELGRRQAVHGDAHEAKVLRTVLRKKGISVPDDRIRSFPLPVPSSRCWSRASAKVRFLVFYSASEDVMGIENSHGGYSSLNKDYAQIVDAVWTAAAWDIGRDRDTGWAPQREAAHEGNNIYLRALAMWFLKEQAADGVNEKLAEEAVAHALAPEASCGPTSR
jgi:hypothetical protein